MAARSDAGGMEKVFEHCEITWKIENCFLATFGKDWIIDSPVIYVREPKTKWKMSLIPNPDDNYSILIRLTRLEYNPGPHSVRVDWLLTLVAMKGEGENEETYLTLEERETSFKMNNFDENILVNKFISEYIVFPFGDTLYIRCQLFVSHRNLDKTYGQFTPENSEDLQNFIKSHGGEKYDILIKNNGMDIQAHKEVLMSSSGYFKNHIKPDTECIILKQDPIGFAHVIAYLYSDDLKHVLSKPNSGLYDSVKQLEIEELGMHYLPKLIKLNTAQDVQYDEFVWVIENVSKIKTSTNFTSPIIHDSSFKISWQLELHIDVEKTNMTISLSGKCIKAANTQMLAYMEFVATSKRKCFWRSGGAGFIIENMKFCEECLKTNKRDIRSSMAGDKLDIIFRLQMLLSRRVSKLNNRAIYFVNK